MKNKTVTQLKKILWKEFSRYIRLRDAIRTTGNTKSALCITCKQLLEGMLQWDAYEVYSEYKARLRGFKIIG